ncbi:hypothetical protein I6B24_10830 [Clostridioides difficile]|nr:hypothetical protein [Clostridioides difficile]
MIDSEEMIFNVEDLIIYRKNQLVIIYNKKLENILNCLKKYISIFF